ncbi:carbohydate-binding domain-containing protein [Shewanella sp. JM162201]|uniref:beta-N-acetylhexosaminidase n=1 Tax=Shewanella jiangmenensis TaxID=2837387 RepID=A0ABS5V729_9GAMM|nr:family 20 glycosylhydrolase [Shewanella jiangmenensis]MBT1446244.1 carbohydate-binding domain-containing protein [Shewanella jiangmenensis]
MKWLWPDITPVAKLVAGLSLLSLPAGFACAGEQYPDSDTLKLSYALENSAAMPCPGKEKQCYLTSITLTAPQAVSGKDWAIYYSQLSPAYQVEGDEFTVTHINGDLHRLSPGPGYQGLIAGKSHQVRLYSKGSQITRSEFMPNFVLVAGDAGSPLKVSEIGSTRLQTDPQTGLEIQPYLAPFSSMAQFKLGKSDNTPLADGRWLYDYYAAIGAAAATSIESGLIPSPTKLERFDGAGPSLAAGFKLELAGADSGRIKPAVASALTRLASLGFAEKAGGAPLRLVLAADEFAGDDVAGASVMVEKQAADNTASASRSEAYRLTLGADGITLVAGGEAGLFYGLQSLAGLIAPGEAQLPAVSIEDSPRYGFRGMHVDLARNFHSLEFLERLIVQMGAYKLNKLHLHLADDEGWRLEIPGLAELTEVGSRRCFDLDENRCLLPQLGSGISGESQVDGYLSVADYRRLLKLAKAHHIEVIPSLDMPGHSRAAIQAMEARYRKLLAAGKEEAAKEFLLTEFDDSTRYSSIQYYHDNTLNVCIDSTYRFVAKVVDEIAAMHQSEGMPLRLYHIGADETAGAWVDSPACKALKAKQGDIHSLNGYFIEKVAAMLAGRGIRAAGWNDGMGETRPERMPADVQSNAWGLLAEGGHNVAHRQMNLGWQVVISTPETTYFDFPYVSHPEETGNHWATRALDSFKVFSFMPDNLPAHAELITDVRGKRFSADDTEPLKPGKRAAGLQGQLWSEMVRSDDMAEYMIYPRMLALAERAWHRADWELEYQAGRNFSKDTAYFDKASEQARARDWQRFATALGQRELPKLEQAGIFYRIAPPGIKAEGGLLYLNHPYPGTKLEYRLDGGNWQPWTAPVAVTGKEIEARAIAADGKRRSRSEQLRLSGA